MLAGQQNVFNAHGRIPLTMAFETAIILTPPEVLNGHLDRGMIDHVAENANPFEDRLADANIFAVGEQDDVPELDARADFRFPVVHLDHVAFAYLYWREPSTKTAYMMISFRARPRGRRTERPAQRPDAGA